MTDQPMTVAPLGTAGAPALQDRPRIYVACLAAYNNGCLHGRWIDATTIDQVLADYPYLEREDILQALQYAAWLAEGQDAETQEEGFADTAHCSVSYRVGAQKADIVKLVLQGYIASKT